MTHAFRTLEQQAENRIERIKSKYTDLVNKGLYENFDSRSFATPLWNAIVHFPSKTVWVYTYPIIGTMPASFIKTCECGGVHFKDLQQDHDEDKVDMESVLDSIRKSLDIDDALLKLEFEPIPFNPSYTTQTKETV
jgi:hypothetical protein